MHNKKEITLLLLGESGVGKSTFINSFVNYLLFNSLSDAINRMVCLIPAKFTLTDPKTKKRKLMTFGVPTNTENTEKTTESATQYPRCYTFDLGDHQLNIIDTPGIADTKGLDKDNQNMQNILNFISHYSVINGICVLLKPNEARVGVIFKYCILELLCHLSKSAANNIMFVFTNARGTFYEPGDTAAALEDVLTQVRQRPPNVEIRFDENNTFCFDNESFRYLVAVSEPNNMVFNKNIKTDYKTSWSRSSKECKRLIKYFENIEPHNVSDTISLNYAKCMINTLLKTLTDINKHIGIIGKENEIRTDNIGTIDENIELIGRNLYVPRIDVESRSLSHPILVCIDEHCCDTIVSNGQLLKHYKSVCNSDCPKSHENSIVGDLSLLNCQAFNLETKQDYCRVCGHSYMTHVHSNYETIKYISDFRDEDKFAMMTTNNKELDIEKDKIVELMDKQKKLDEERDVINKCMTQLSKYILLNSLTPFNDAFEDYVEQLIDGDKHNDSQMATSAVMDEQSVQKLKDILLESKYEKIVLLDSMKNMENNNEIINLDNIDDF
ncbi:uncharacterized protein LOC128963291 [Oppia nitens]|uniref:uncharacterized protein LOC128963291 n=1 Tax=Oppia nitens TaxID=1686743 RepID=UPI0023DBD185|nr:uncharacterized protein LOC128963291 [Oppia nitens]